MFVKKSCQPKKLYFLTSVTYSGIYGCQKFAVFNFQLENESEMDKSKLVWKLFLAQRSLLTIAHPDDTTVWFHCLFGSIRGGLPDIGIFI